MRGCLSDLIRDWLSLSITTLFINYRLNWIWISFPLPSEIPFICPCVVIVVDKFESGLVIALGLGSSIGVFVGKSLPMFPSIASVAFVVALVSTNSF